jgi:hypothetical protein
MMWEAVGSMASGVLSIFGGAAMVGFGLGGAGIMGKEAVDIAGITVDEEAQTIVGDGRAVVEGVGEEGVGDEIVEAAPTEETGAIEVDEPENRGPRGLTPGQRERLENLNAEGKYESIEKRDEAREAIKRSNAAKLKKATVLEKFFYGAAQSGQGVAGGPCQIFASENNMVSRKDSSAATLMKSKEDRSRQLYSNTDRIRNDITSTAGQKITDFIRVCGSPA